MIQESIVVGSQIAFLIEWSEMNECMLEVTTRRAAEALEMLERTSAFPPGRVVPCIMLLPNYVLYFSSPGIKSRFVALDGYLLL